MNTLALNEKIDSPTRNIRNALNSFFEVVFFEKPLRMHGYNIGKPAVVLGVSVRATLLCPIAAPSAHGRAGSNVKVGKDG
jgi:hypothetical protein